LPGWGRIACVPSDLKGLPLNQSAISHRFSELQQYVGWTDMDAARVRIAAPLLKPYLSPVIDDFYQEIQNHPDAARVITGGAVQVERLKQTLIAWLGELLSGQYDDAYAARRWKVGFRHVSIGLAQIYTNMALSRLKKGLLRALRECWTGDLDTLLSVTESLSTLFDMDLALIQEAYEFEHNYLLQRNERLATLGQVSGGIAHELRNPLNAISTSAYFLTNARGATPEKTAEHLARISRQVDVANRVVTALSDFARQRAPEMSPFSLRDCLIDVLETQQPPSEITVTMKIPENCPKILGDAEQLRIAFDNLIRNACDAIEDTGEITLTAEVNGGLVDFSVRDTGRGITADDLPKIMEPLFSTKAQGIGLGLAITRAILEKHGSELSVDSQPGHGATFTIRLTADQPEAS